MLEFSVVGMMEVDITKGKCFMSGGKGSGLQLEQKTLAAFFQARQFFWHLSPSEQRVVENVSMFSKGHWIMVISRDFHHSDPKLFGLFKSFYNKDW